MNNFFLVNDLKERREKVEENKLTYLVDILFLSISSQLYLKWQNSHNTFTFQYKQVSWQTNYCMLYLIKYYYNQ